MKNTTYNIILLIVGCLILQLNVVYGTNAPFINPETGQVHNFVAGNYTDLGVDGGGNMSSNENTLRSNAATELNRLRDVGVTNVRVWPFAHHSGNFDKMANRVAWLADEAAQRNMTLTVDLFDSSGNNSYANITANSDRIDDMINNVIAPNANKSNIYWSLGNEIGGWEDPLAFAAFYEQKVAAMRAAGALHISFHPVPGSLNHNWGGNNNTEQAARRCIQASDDVSPHFYAVGAVSNESAANGGEFNSLQQYINIAHELCKPTIIGEFGITGFCNEGYSQRTPGNVTGWLQYFNNDLKVDQVSFWQFMKETVGHLDDQCFSTIVASCNGNGMGTGNGTHEGAMVGYLNNPPAHPGTCNNPGNGGSDCPTNLNVTSYQNSTAHLQAANTVTCSADINSGADVKCSAGSLVTLTNGFHAKSGSDFHAFIQDCEDTTPPGGECEILTNHNFDSNINGWKGYGCNASSSGGVANITVTQPGDQLWSAIFREETVNLTQGKTYTLSIKVAASGTRQVILKVVDPAKSHLPYDSHTINLTTSMQTFNFPSFTMPESINGAYVELLVGRDTPNVQVDFISLKESDCSTPPPPSGGDCQLLTNTGFDSGFGSWTVSGCNAEPQGNGTVQFQSMTVNVNNVSVSKFGQSGLTFQQGGNYALTFTVQANNNRSISAKVQDGPATEFQLTKDEVTTRTLNYSHQGSTTNNGKVEIFLGANGAWLSFDSVELTGPCNNKQDASLAPDIQLYPNPATRIINVEYELPQSTSSNILVFDAFGKVVKNVADVELFAGKQTLNMDISDLAAGMYFYTLQANEWKATNKFIIVR